MDQPHILMTGRGLVESPRWHDGRFWFADWTSGEILSVEADGSTVVQAQAPAPPLSFDFAADGRMLIVASSAGQLLRREIDGTLSTFAEFGEGQWNEVVVDGRGNAYINGPRLLLVTPDGNVSAQADEFAFPNGMAVTPDNQTLIIAESYARRLTAFTIDGEGRLSDRRIWAELDGPPDGICIDEAGAVWYADVPNAYCRRVSEGGEVLDEVKLDRGAFACILGGAARKTLMIAAAQWFGMARMGEMGGTGQLLTKSVPVGGTGWP